jgi:signal transduction histidine kinase
MARRKRQIEDAVIVAIGVAALLEIWLSEIPGTKWPLVAIPLAGVLGLLVRQRLPLVGPLTPFVAVAVVSSLAAKQLESTGVVALLALAAAWFIGRENERSRALVGLAIAFACDQILAANFEQNGIGDFIFIGMIAVGPWLAGQFVRSRELQAEELRKLAERLEQDREQQARAAVADERLRIARELHDVVAHSISVMTIQAGAARLLLDEEPEQAEEPLLRVEETGHQTLSEMRRLLGVLQNGGPGQGLEARPTLAKIGSLLDQFRAAGLPVELELVGEPNGLPAGVDLAAYRVVQEALTNVLKHAGVATARVSIRFTPRALELEVADDGAGPTAARAAGHGLVGMRERVAIYGGEFEAGARASGGYFVRARLPLAGDGS